ncbi:MAG TPA: DUF4339 domain-containing protein [Nannocystis exedens]|nr:DUF4339 domain-containing protein [Nannocystis exedens]
MKIECDKCGAKYSIADEKVRGKTFKIRCKKCSNVIIVRDKTTSAGAEEPPAAEADHDHGQEQEQDGADPGWHLAIDGDTVGPLAEQDVRDRFAAGSIDGETSVWQEGFDDWLPLSEVEAFSDLAAASAPAAADDGAAAAAAAPAAADPFAASSDDDYGGSGFGGSEPEPEPEEAGHSPRVDDLTGARNENSVLFSLDSLSAVALGGAPKQAQRPAASTPSGPSFSVAPASSAPASQTTAQGEGSGLIDIRAMSAMLGDSDGGGGGEASGGAESFGDSAIPSFGGGFGGLAAAPLSIDSPDKDVPVVAPEPVKSSNGPLYALIGVMALGLMGITTYVLTRPPPEGKTTEIIKIVPGAVPDDDDEGSSKKKKKSDDEDEDADLDVEPDVEEPESAGATTKKKSRKKGTKKKGGSSDKPADAGSETKVDTPKKKVAKKPDDVSVDCLLDPSKCKKGGGGGGGGGSSAPPDPSLPKKLGAPDLKAGSSAAKKAAKSNCKSKSKGGEKVVVKLSIEGATGKVASATADSSALGKCVAAELKKAKFKKFQAKRQGVQISVRF